MNIQEAVKILRKHNEWRRYEGPIGQGPEMVNQTELGIAIDTVCDEMDDNREKPRLAIVTNEEHLFYGLRVKVVKRIKWLDLNDSEVFDESDLDFCDE